jgi:hypothetical protein
MKSPAPSIKLLTNRIKKLEHDIVLLQERIRVLEASQPYLILPALPPVVPAPLNPFPMPYIGDTPPYVISTSQGNLSINGKPVELMKAQS